MLKAESPQSTPNEKIQAYEMISQIIDSWIQTAIQASRSGFDFALSASIRIPPLIDCLINGLCNPFSGQAIVTSTQDNLCSMVQLSPSHFEYDTLGDHKVGKMCAQLLHNVTEEDDLIR